MTTAISCVTRHGEFQYGIHKPAYQVANLRPPATPLPLGCDEAGERVDNRANYPQGRVTVAAADWIFEIPNAFPFRGRTYINRAWADTCAEQPARIALPRPEGLSLSQTLARLGVDGRLLDELPRPLQLALATTSTDPADLTRLAELSCRFVQKEGEPLGLLYHRDRSGRLRPQISDEALFEAVANNPHTPDGWKIAMVVRPGAQGGSEIVGDWRGGTGSHAYEYLRRNSYIPGGHYAANMADDAIRYTVADLSPEDLRGLRHLYYQRTFVRLAELQGIKGPAEGRQLNEDELEGLRRQVLADREGLAAAAGGEPTTLWGWNFGFDFAPSRYRLHASHQQVHQQYALVPGEIDRYTEGMESPQGKMAAYGCGDQIAAWLAEYRHQGNGDFFAKYRQAIAGNRRMDGRDDLSADLTVWRDERVLLFVPKAQTSAWELQLMTLPDEKGRLPGNILECDSACRRSLDLAMLKGQQALAALGARLVHSIEYPSRLGGGWPSQPLLYALLPRLPESPGAFSEAQLRWIIGHYPEDFAAACRRQLA